MPPNSNFVDLLRVFNEEEVKYLVVGGYAFMFYSNPRFTKDLDIWVEASQENSVRVFRALARFGAPLRGLTAADFAEPEKFYQLGIAPNRIDVLTSITGLEFEDTWQRRQASEFGGTTAWFISREDLIRNKRAVGRRQDLIDADLLEGKLEE